jgi:tetratricopeptide (TPR) repeat protein
VHLISDFGFRISDLGRARSRRSMLDGLKTMDYGLRSPASRSQQSKVHSRAFGSINLKSVPACILIVIIAIVFAAMPASSGAEPASEAGADASGRVSSGVGVVEAYQELLKENLALRERMSELTDTAEQAKGENKRLNLNVKDLESRVVELAALIKDLTSAQSERKDPEEVAKLEQQVQAAKSAQTQLQGELAGMKERIAVLKAEAAAPAERGPRIAPGSDLFRQLEQENAQLKERLLQLESDRRGVTEDKQGLNTLLAQKEAALVEMEQTLAASKQDQKNVVKIVKHVRRMQAEISDLKGTISEKDDAIEQKEQEVAELEQAVKQEQQKLQKIKKLAVLMDRIDQERVVHRMSDTAKVELYRRAGDKHYEAGRYAFAEKEYLKALKVDPSVADVHYNLGVLYDQALKKKSRALVHYAAYMELRPNAGDIHLVKLWVREAELSQAEVNKAEVDKTDRIATLMGTLEPVGVDASLSKQRDSHIRKGSALALDSQFKKAIAEYEQALKLDPYHADIHYNLGVIYDDELQENEKAVRHYRKYLELRPRAADSDLVRSWMMGARIDS